MKNILAICFSLLCASVSHPTLATYALGTATLSASVGSPDCSGDTSGLTASQCLAATTTIPNGTLDGSACSEVSMVADIKVTEGTGGNTGTIVTHWGAAGTAWPASQTGITAGFLTAAVARGQRVVQIHWHNGGWLTGKCGALTQVNRVCSVIQSIHDNANGFTLYNASTAFAFWGQSAGSSAGAYCMAHYGQASIIDMLIISSGPPHSRQDYNDQGSGIPYWATNGPGLRTSGSGLIIATPTECLIVDGAYSLNATARTPCANNSSMGGVNNLGYRDSIMRGNDVQSFPQTDCVAVYGDADVSAAVPLGNLWWNAITCKSKTRTVTNGSQTHNQVPGSASGAAAINTALAAATFNH